MLFQKWLSYREAKLKRYAILKIVEIANSTTSSDVKNYAIDAIKKIANLGSDDQKKNNLKFIKPIVTNLKKDIKK